MADASGEVHAPAAAEVEEAAAQTTPPPENRAEDRPDTPDTTDEKAVQAKAILTRAVEAKKEFVPTDPIALQAQSIANAAVARSRGEAPSSPQQGMAGAMQEDDVFAKLAPSQRSMLRGYYQDPATGEWNPYLVGELKSYSSKSGYGFVACSRATAYWGVDVFVHKNQVPVPWNLGQVVEFAAVINQRGQPQATDCFWLPKVQQQRPHAYPVHRPMQQAGYSGSPTGASGFGFNPNAPSFPGGANKQNVARAAPVSPGPAAASASAASEGEGPATADSRNISAEGPFFLGTLKSFSSAQGYGFLQCDDVFKLHQRDIYFDRSQLPRPPIYNQGQTVEFAVNLNGRGQPQAKCLVWDCIPLLPLDPTKDPNHQNKHSPASLEKCRKLLRLLNESDKEAAVVTAIDYQGVEKVPDTEDRLPDVDYVTYVLDRLGMEGEAVSKIKDFVKMLLLLMLAKMLRKKFGADRVNKLTRWLSLLSSAIDPSTEKQVQDHFMDVVGQIEGNLQKALNENPATHEASVTKTIQDVLEQLKSKGRPPPAAA